MADATVAAAENPGGSSLGEVGFGMMGMSAMQQTMQQQQQQQQQQQGEQQGQQAAPAVPDVMTPEEAAAILKVTREDVETAIEAGELKARKIGNAYRISRANLEEFLNG